MGLFFCAFEDSLGKKVRLFSSRMMLRKQQNSVHPWVSQTWVFSGITGRAKNHLSSKKFLVSTRLLW